MSAGMVIVGAGECGARAAAALREAGYAGSVNLIGAERHLPYERPPLSKELMVGNAAFAPRTILAAARMAELGISFHPDVSALAVDRHGKMLALSNGTSLRYDKLLLATGALPRQMPFAHPGCLYLRTYDDARAIRSVLGSDTSLCVVGGGFIGLELAAGARRLGAAVTVIEALPRLLTRGVPEEIARRLQVRHEAEGVQLVFGRGIAAIGDGILSLDDGREIKAELIVIGIGAVPNTALAAEAGLAIDNGIAVDATLRTSDPDILAAGDCCSFPLAIYDGRRVRLESWRSAQELGTLAARNMLGANEAHAHVPWFWTDQYDLTLQIAGLPDEGSDIVRREWDGALVLFHLKPDGRLVAASGISQGNAVARDIRVAEMLIARRAHPDRTALGAPDIKLKSLLAA